MKAARRLISAAAAAGLLAAGCDYWKNLVDEKSVTVVPVTIKVQDAFTGEMLDKVTCTDADRGLAFTTDSRGVYENGEMGTGPYTLDCSRPEWYFDRRMEFDVQGHGGTVVVDMARRGGEEWYPDEQEKRVHILNPPAYFRLPLNTRISAYPSVDDGAFRYEWAFRKNEKLNPRSGQESSHKSYFNLNADSTRVLPGPDLLTLTVWATLAGQDEYLVGRDSLPIEWTRNRLPVGEVYASAPTLRFGCGAAYTRLFIFANVSDPDPGGSCDSVVIQSKDPASMFGKLDTSVTCAEAARGVPIAVKDPFGGKEGRQLQRDYDLFVSSWDDNKTHRDDTLTIKANSNVPPTITRGKVGPGNVVFINERVRYWFKAHDEDDPVNNVAMNWGNGPQDYPPLTSDGHDATDTVDHYYKYEDTVIVTAFVRDNCEASGQFPPPRNEMDPASTQADSLYIRRNTDPSIQVTSIQSYISKDSLFYSFRLSLTDIDVEQRHDGFTRIWIVWEDKTSEEIDPPPHGAPFENKPKTHAFALPGPASGFYIMRIFAEDEHEGGGNVTVQIPIPEH